MRPRPVSDLRNKGDILAITDRYRFPDKADVERFMMDFEVQLRIGREIECAVRGGMCVPFRVPSGTVSRLSRDIDLMVRAGGGDVQSAMKKVCGGGARLVAEQIRPSDPKPVSNLLSYKVKYDSALGGRKSIKVDFMHDVDAEVPTEEVEEVELFGMRLAHPATVLTRGALIADKMTALALGEIGLGPKKHADVPKQIHDVGTQIRMSGRDDVAQALETFGALTGFKTGKYEHDPPYTVASTLRAVTRALDAFVEIDTAVHMRKEHKERYESFCATYLSRPRTYEPARHLEDVLLAAYLAEVMGKCCGSPQDRDALAAAAARTIRRARETGALDRARRKEAYRAELNGLPVELIKHKKTLHNAKLEHLILLSAIHKIRARA